MASRSEPASSGSLRGIFAFFWGLYGLHYSLLTSELWLASAAWGRVELAAWSVALSSALLVIRPNKTAVLAVQCAAWVLYGLARHPSLVNHTVVTVFLAAALVLSLIGKRHELFDRFAPVGRWTLLAIYFFAVLHKLNRDFFDPGASCAWSMYADVAGWVPFLPTWDALRVPIIGGVIAAEASIPLLLAGRRTRRWGIALGSAFHASLALHTNIFVGDFALLMLCGLTLFLPAESAATLERAWQRSSLRRRLARVGVAGWIVAAAAASVLLTALAWALADGVQLGARHVPFYQIANRALFASVFAVWVAVAWTVLRGAPRGDAGALRLPASPAAAIPILLLVYGLQPYLGLGTTPVLSMFSNLRVEERSNHLFVPKSLQRTGLLDDVVEMVEASDPTLLEAGEDGSTRYPFVWWQRLLSAHTDPHLEVTVLRGGKRLTLRRDEAPTPEIFVPGPAWTRWLDWRPVPEPGLPARCLH